MLNDPTQIEAARALADKAIKASDEKKRIEWMFRQCLGRSATAREQQIVAGSVAAFAVDFKDSPEAAGELMEPGQKSGMPQDQLLERATWTMVANLIMNMDEFVSKN